jgi:hypothetical protein
MRPAELRSIDNAGEFGPDEQTRAVLARRGE